MPQAMNEDPVSRAAERFGDEPALLGPNAHRSFRDYDRHVADAVATLAAAGVRHGDRVALAWSPGAELVLATMAVIRLGATAFPVNPRLPARAVGAVLSMSGTRYLVGAPDDSGDADWEGVTLLDMSEVGAGRDGDGPAATATPGLAADRDATLILTSGSSGRPKAALHSLANHLYSAAGANENMPFAPGDRWLLSLPLYHVGGLAILFRSLLGGGAVAIPESGVPLLQSLREGEITHLSLVPTQLYRLLEDGASGVALPRLKAVLIGGGVASRELITRALHAGLPIHCSYGLTEMSSQVTAAVVESRRVRVLTAGKTLPYRELVIGDGGEILVRGETLFKGYVDADGLSAAVDDEGWFHTRDLGQLTPAGDLLVAGRKDNMFISGGENIQPEEIEERLVQMPDVAEALVVPVADAEFGQRPVAFLRVGSGPMPSLAAVRHSLRAHLPRFKLPDAVYDWPEAPSRPGIKVLRRQFIALAEACRREEAG